MPLLDHGRSPVRHGFVLCAILSGCRTAEPSVAGDWIGDAGPPGGTARIEVSIDSAGTSARITLAAWSLDTVATRLTPGDVLTFVAVVGNDTLRLTGTTHEGRWRGAVSLGARREPLEMVRLFPLDEDEQRSLIGTYRSENGHLIAIAPFSEFGDRPMLIDYETGRMGPLYPLSRDRILVGQSLIASLLPGDTLTATRSAAGSVERIHVAGQGRTTVAAKRLATRDEEVQFRNDSIQLAGTLVLPAGPPPWPAIVLVHGSNAQTRDVFGPWARFFAAQGYATLSYDKRGTGKSTGDWKAADFEVLASDVIAAVRYLATRHDIRSDRIGLWGISQAGWILPIVAARAVDAIGFMVVHAGSGTTAREQGILHLRSELRAAGLAAPAVEVGLRYRQLDDAVTSGRARWEELERYYNEKRIAEPWLWPPQPGDDWFRGYYRMLMDFDPAPYWRRVRCPVLLFFGELDVNVPPAESWAPIERALREGGNSRVTQVVLPSANHVFLEAKTGGRDEYPHLSRFVPGYFDRMAEWLRDVNR